MIDFMETFSPIVKHATIQLVLSIVVSYGWPTLQLDGENAFLHENLQEEVFMTQPQGYIHPHQPHHVCKLYKSLYGLRQASRAQFSKHSDKLKLMHFYESKAENSLFILKTKIEVLYILIYVDDILIIASSSHAINRIIQYLKAKFAIKELGDLHFFFRVEAARSFEGLYLTQRKYIIDLLKRSNMDNTKPCTTPMASNCHLTANDGLLCSDINLYQSIEESLQYLAFTCLYLAFVVTK